MSAELIYPPHNWQPAQNKPIIFLAGSIEMGKASNWQEQVSNELKDFDITILNPRRADWDSSWLQTADNPPFRTQVEWELTGIKSADIVIFHLEGSTFSPISLMELGLVADKNKAVVHCEPNFWRKGNVDIVCQHYGIAQVATLNELIDYTKHKIITLQKNSNI